MISGDAINTQKENEDTRAVLKIRCSSRHNAKNGDTFFNEKGGVCVCDVGGGGYGRFFPVTFDLIRTSCRSHSGTLSGSAKSQFF